MSLVHEARRRCRRVVSRLALALGIPVARLSLSALLTGGCIGLGALLGNSAHALTPQQARLAVPRCRAGEVAQCAAACKANGPNATCQRACDASDGEACLQLAARLVVKAAAIMGALGMGTQLFETVRGVRQENADRRDMASAARNAPKTLPGSASITRRSDSVW